MPCKIASSISSLDEEILILPVFTSVLTEAAVSFGFWRGSSIRFCRIFEYERKIRHYSNKLKVADKSSISWEANLTYLCFNWNVLQVAGGASVCTLLHASTSDKQGIPSHSSKYDQCFNSYFLFCCSWPRQYWERLFMRSENA